MVTRQHGMALIPVLFVLAALAASGVYMNHLKSQQQLAVQRGYESIGAEVNEIHAAALRFFRANYPDQRFPTNMAELVSSGHYIGRSQSPVGTDYVFQTTDLPSGVKLFNVSVDALSARAAGAAATIVHNGVASGSVLQSNIRAPFQNEIYDDYMQRYADASRPEMTVFETNVSFAGEDRDILAIEEMQAFSAQIEELVAPRMISRELNAEVITFDNASRITSAGTGLLVDSESVGVTGDLSVGGSIDMQGNDIVDAGRVNAAEVFATTGQIDDITGVNLNYTNGTVQILTGQSLNYVTGEIENLTGVELDYLNGTVRNLAGDSVTYQAGSISSVNGNNLNYSTGSISSVSGTTLNYSTGYLGNVSGLSLTYQSGWIGSASGSNITYSTGLIGNIGGNTASYGNFTGGNFNGNGAEFNSLVVSGPATLNTLTSQFYRSTNYRAQNASADNVNVSSTTTSNIVNSSTSSLGSAQASSFDVTGLLSSAGLSVNLATVQNGQITTVTGTNMTYNTITAGEFRGGAFYGDDFVLNNGDSENKIRADLDRRKTELDNCMYVTEYCLGRPPAVSISCPGCIREDSVSNFTALATVTISQCRHGCDYSWSFGSGVSGSCSAGSIAPTTDARTLQCSISGTVSAQETLNSAVSFYAENIRRPDKNASTSATVRWRNTSPPIPPFWDNMRAGCWIDTDAMDAVSSGGFCGSAGLRSAPFHDATVAFSVGDTKNVSNEYWLMSQPGVSITWTGGCTGTGNSCSVRGSCSSSTDCPALGVINTRATVVYGSLTKVFDLVANDNTRHAGAGPIE